MKHTVSLLLFFLLLGTSIRAQQSQIKVFPQDTIQLTGQFILEGLLSDGVQLQEIKTNFKASSPALGYFHDPVRYFGMEQGMMLSTGMVTNVDRGNAEEDYTSLELDADQLKALQQSVSALADSTLTTTQVLQQQQLVANVLNQTVTGGDADLSKEIGGLPTYDARVIEMTFIPTADSLYFRYVFASDEYDEYVCSQFNDVFAFYLSEVGQTPKNIALLPGQTLPVSINTVNNGNPANPNCEKSNSHLFQKNNGQQNLLYDGFTKVLDIREKVTPGKVYKLKIAIADASDGALDSSVLLENSSIFSYYSSFEIPFGGNSDQPVAQTDLEAVLDAMLAHPNSRVQLIGHADRYGATDYNFDLSVKRVEAIKNYLMAHGVDEDRIVLICKGESMPRYEDHTQNRRVEVFVMGEQELEI